MPPEATSQSKDTPAARALEQSVNRLMVQGKLKEAISSCNMLNRDFPDYDAGWHTASQLALQLKNPRAALQAIDRAVVLAPEKAQWLLQRGICLAQLGRNADARAVALQLSERLLPTAYLCSSLGLLLSRLELHEHARKQYQRAIELAPDNGGNYYNLATVQRFLGELEAAETNLSRAIKLNSADYDAYYARSELRQQTADDNHIEELQGLIDAGINSPKAKVQMLFALAKESEDIAAAEQSFDYLKQGADLRRQHLQYDVQSDLDTMQSICTAFGAELFDGRISGSPNREPLFVLGLPRTGTTLVERMLGSHSRVHPAGELNNFARTMMGLVQAVASRQAGGGQRPATRDLVALSARIDFRQLGEAYVQSTRPTTGHTPYFVDKQPLNFLYAGLIHLALPGAKIIHLDRQPMDSCYAIYKTLFQDVYPFSYQLDELGQYYLGYRQLMAHWHEVLPGVIHTVRYEDLVGNFEAETRRLLQYCELPWEDRCLRFHDSRSASTTASAAQVRRGIYSSSVGKWRQYAHQLTPLKEQLLAAGVAID